MYQTNYRNLIYFHAFNRHKKSRKGKYWYYCPNKKLYNVFIARKSLYRNPASVYRSRRERKTNSYAKVFRIADVFSSSRSKMLK